MKFMLLFLVCALSYADTPYLASSQEKSALVYVFGQKIAREIEQASVITSRNMGSVLATYHTSSRKIYVNPNKVAEFRDRLSIVHEGAHYFQRVYLGDFRSTDNVYSMTSYEPEYKLPIEREAEVVRALGFLWAYGYLPEAIFTDLPRLRDSKLLRDQLWLYLEIYMSLKRPIGWDIGTVQ